MLESRSPAESDPPEAMLVGFERLELDGDGKTVYFTTPAWVTSTAAHAVEVATGKTRFLFDGVVERVLPDGLHAGKLLASHYRLDTKYPVESPKYRGRMETWTIATPEGKTVLTLPDDERLRDAALRRPAR